MHNQRQLVEPLPTHHDLTVFQNGGHPPSRDFFKLEILMAHRLYVLLALCYSPNYDHETHALASTVISVNHQIKT